MGPLKGNDRGWFFSESFQLIRGWDTGGTASAVTLLEEAANLFPPQPGFEIKPRGSMEFTEAGLRLKNP